jgi:hypothetical protein
MALSRLSVLLILYVAADFANPLMPGAVTFLDGSVQGVHVERTRFTAVSPATPAPAPRERIEVLRLTRYVLPPMPIAPIAWVRLVPIRNALLVASASSPPSEDH